MAGSAKFGAALKGVVTSHHEGGEEKVNATVTLADDDGKRSGEAITLTFPAGSEPRVRTWLEVSVKEIPAPTPAEEG